MGAIYVYMYIHKKGDNPVDSNKNIHVLVSISSPFR